MAPGSPKPAHGPASSVSSLDSFSSEESHCRPTARPRRATLLRNSIESSHSHEHLGTVNPDATQPLHPLIYSGAGRFFKPRHDDQPYKKRLRERASFSKCFPRPDSSRSAWPSSSTRDLLKEAGDWLDAQYPVPDVQIPDTDWHLASSPRQDFPPSPILSSRPSTSSTSKEEIVGANEKIVYMPREAKLRELLEDMQRDLDRGNDIKNDREVRVRYLLKEMQDKNEERAAQAKNTAEEAVELDTTKPQNETRHSITVDDNSEPSFSLSSCSHGSTDEAQSVHYPPSDQSLRQSLSFIDLPTDTDLQFSVAIAQALKFSHLPELEKSETNVRAQTKETPVELSHSKAESFNPAVYSCAANQNPPNQPNSGTTPAIRPKFDGGTITPTANTEKISSIPSVAESSSSTTPPQQIDSPVMDDAAVRSLMSLPLPESPASHDSVFSELEDLVEAFRARRRMQPGVISAEPG